MNSNESILAGVRRDLTRTRGTWTKVAQSSGVPYHTLVKIAQGTVLDPRVSTVQRLVDYFATNCAPSPVVPAAEVSHG